MILYCPRCGAAPPVRMYGDFGADARCIECGVALAEARAMLAPSDEELEYVLDEWPVGDRAALTTALAADGIPYRWDPGVVLVVPAVAEEEVDTILGHLERHGQDEEGQAGDGADAADGGEEAHAAMVELFLAADRLRNAPLDQEVAAALEVAAEEVVARLPPYGIDPAVWRRIGDMAAAAVAAVETRAGKETIARDARGLRNLLRDYV